MVWEFGLVFREFVIFVLEMTDEVVLRFRFRRF